MWSNRKNGKPSHWGTGIACFAAITLFMSWFGFGLTTAAAAPAHSKHEHAVHKHHHKHHNNKHKKHVKSLVPASVVAQAKKHPLSPYPSQHTIASVSIGQSVPTMSVAPLEVAKEMNFFGYLGLNVTYQTLQSGATMDEALVGGTLTAGSEAGTDAAELAAKGVKVETIDNIMPFVLQLCVMKSWAQSHHVSPKSSLTKKADALKGATFGITGPGALSDSVGRWFMKQYAKITPNTGMTAVTTPSSSMAPSLEAGKIDAFWESAPTCEEAKGTEALVQGAQVKQFRDSAMETLVVSKTYAQSHANVMTRMATAVAMGAEFIKKHPTEAVLLLESLYPTTSPSVVSTAFRTGILPSVTGKVKFKSSMWKSINTILLVGGQLTTPISTKATGIWTNKYIKAAAAKLF